MEVEPIKAIMFLASEKAVDLGKEDILPIMKLLRAKQIENYPNGVSRKPIESLNSMLTNAHTESDVKKFELIKNWPSKNHISTI